MNFAYTMQKFQDWFTQQWIIIWGRKLNPKDINWLMGPFGEMEGIGENFIQELAQSEDLEILRNCQSVGLLNSMDLLKLPQEDLTRLSKGVIQFYENTSEYGFKFKVNWNLSFKIFGILINKLFSQRINQLNIPSSQPADSQEISSELIQLIDKHSKEVNYTIWLRKLKSSGQIIYSGIYGICEIPSGTICIKAVFPLPKGNATIILKPKVGEKGELILQSIGKKFGDPGFYFLLSDSKNSIWSLYHSSFSDELMIHEKNQKLYAIQTLRLWNFRVVTFQYEIENR
ncbi:hypothetical protein [Moheibacter stercoris]|uniref:Uncharacterized protein n=1 Tax=Moheibacter stercoris TaxID=1628251 RepID=A0ABV2LT84_9FLAO